MCVLWLGITECTVQHSTVYILVFHFDCIDEVVEFFVNILVMSISKCTDIWVRFAGKVKRN